VDGKPVATRLQMPVTFEFENMAGIPNADGLPPPTSGLLQPPAKMPVGLRYDVAPRVRGEIRAIYPYDRYVRGPDKATATIWALVDSHGTVTQMGIVDATEPAFGFAALAACQCVEYTPALLNEKPTDAVLTLKLKFNKDILRREFAAAREYGDDGLFSARQVYADIPFRTVAKNEVPFPVPARTANF
jgi:hypothetical protein